MDNPRDDTTEPRLARSIRSITRVTIGAVLSVGDQAAAIVNDHQKDERKALPSAEDENRLRHMIIGSAFAASDRAVELSHVASRAAGRISPYTNWVWEAPVIAPLRRRVDGTIDDLIERGKVEENLGRAQAKELYHGALDSAVASPQIDDIVGDVVGRVLDPVLDEALPKVLGNISKEPEMMLPLVTSIVDKALDPILAEALPKVLGNIEQQPEMMLPLVTAIVREALDPILQEALPKVLGNIEQEPEMMVPLVEALVGEALEPVLQQALPQVIDVLNEDPEAIRSLVRDQSTGIAADLAHNVRSRAATADDRVDRIVRRITGRKAPPAELAAGSRGALPAASDDR